MALLAAVVPLGAHALAAPGRGFDVTQLPTCSVTAKTAVLAFSEGNTTLGGFGSTQGLCIGNAMTGVTSVVDYSYVLVLATNGTTAPAGWAHIVDTATNVYVASAPVVLPTNFTVDTIVAVTALFDPPALLDPAATYVLALCSDKTGDTRYGLRMDAAPSATAHDALRYCSGVNCSNPFSTWAARGVPSALVANATYSCMPPSQPGEGTLTERLVANVSATFDTQHPGAVIAAPTGGTIVGALASLVDIRAGDVDLAVSWEPANASAHSATYGGCLVNSTVEMRHTFAYYAAATQAPFADSVIDTIAASLKWSLSAQANRCPLDARANSTDRALDAMHEANLTVSYLVFDASNSSDAPVVVSVAEAVSRGGGSSGRVPYTAYRVVLDFAVRASLVIDVEAIDIALVDDVVQPVAHKLVAVRRNGTLGCLLSVSFPTFSTSLDYDPSLGIGVLVGVDASNPKGGDTILGMPVFALALVAATVACLFIVGAGVLAVALTWRARRRRLPSRNSVNFDALHEPCDRL